jgi:hypothetical protein
MTDDNQCSVPIVPIAQPRSALAQVERVAHSAAAPRRDVARRTPR